MTTESLDLLVSKDPFLKIEMILEDRYLFFNPSLDDEDENLIKLIQVTLNSIFQVFLLFNLKQILKIFWFQIGTKMRRISKRKTKDYFEDIQMKSQLLNIKKMILEQVQQALLKTQTHKSSFDK